MTKPLSAAQKAANKKQRAQRQDDARRDANVKANRSDAGPKELTRLLNAPFKAASKKAKSAKVDRASKMPTKTAKQRAQKAAVALHDAGGTVTHDVAAIAAGALKSGATVHVTTSGKLDMEAREQPLKGVRGRVAPKPAPARAARSKSATPAQPAAARELKYVDAGEGHPHRFSGRNWDGVLYRSANGTLGLERSTDEGKTWTRYLGDDEFISRDRWDLGRAIQRSTKEKSHDIKPRRVAGAVTAKPARRARSKPEPMQKRDKDLGPTRSESMRAEAPAPEVDHTRWQRAEVSTTCQWGHGEVMKGQKPCIATSTRRVVCNNGRNFVDVCERHEKAYLTTKSSKWVGCTSYALTPTGPKLDGATSKNETPAEEVVKV